MYQSIRYYQKFIWQIPMTTISMPLKSNGTLSLNEN